MVNGLHAIIYTSDPEATRAFFKDVLGWPHVDAGAGWLIFKSPPAELAVHPAPEGKQHELFLMCEDIEAAVADLKAKGAKITEPIADERFGLITYIDLPGAGSLGLYQPKHPTAI